MAQGGGGLGSSAPLPSELPSAGVNDMSPLPPDLLSALATTDLAAAGGSSTAASSQAGAADAVLRPASPMAPLPPTSPPDVPLSSTEPGQGAPGPHNHSRDHDGAHPTCASNSINNPPAQGRGSRSGGGDGGGGDAEGRGGGGDGGSSDGSPKDNTGNAVSAAAVANPSPNPSHHPGSAPAKGKGKAGKKGKGRKHAGGSSSSGTAPATSPATSTAPPTSLAVVPAKGQTQPQAAVAAFIAATAASNGGAASGSGGGLGASATGMAGLASSGTKKGQSTVAREIDTWKKDLLDKSSRRVLTSEEVGAFQIFLNRLQTRLAEKRARYEKRARILKMLIVKRPHDNKFADELQQIMKQTEVLNKDITLFNETLSDFQSSPAFQNIYTFVRENYEKIGNDASTVYVKKEQQVEEEDPQLSFEDLVREEKRLEAARKAAATE
eukprot:m.52369 g.52369  ORF g.52369 m.52369 type:complete len:438 (+) comp12288_c0_seq1:136-1449(+)